MHFHSRISWFLHVSICSSLRWVSFLIFIFQEIKNSQDLIKRPSKANKSGLNSWAGSRWGMCWLWAWELAAFSCGFLSKWSPARCSHQCSSPAREVFSEDWGPADSGFSQWPDPKSWGFAAEGCSRSWVVQSVGSGLVFACPSHRKVAKQSVLRVEKCSVAVLGQLRCADSPRVVPTSPPKLSSTLSLTFLLSVTGFLEAGPPFWFLLSPKAVSFLFGRTAPSQPPASQSGFSVIARFYPWCFLLAFHFSLFRSVSHPQRSQTWFDPFLLTVGTCVPAVLRALGFFQILLLPPCLCLSVSHQRAAPFLEHKAPTPAASSSKIICSHFCLWDKTQVETLQVAYFSTLLFCFDFTVVHPISMCFCSKQSLSCPCPLTLLSYPTTRNTLPGWI